MAHLRDQQYLFSSYFLFTTTSRTHSAYRKSLPVSCSHLPASSFRTKSSCQFRCLPPSSQPIMLLSLHRTAVIAVSLSICTVSVLTLPTTTPISTPLNITTIGAANGKSTLECWQLSAPLVTSSQPGTAGAAIAQLGETGATSYTLLPPHYDGGLHNAPAVQYVFIRSFLLATSPCSSRPLFFPLSHGTCLNTRRANPFILGALDG